MIAQNPHQIDDLVLEREEKQIDRWGGRWLIVVRPHYSLEAITFCGMLLVVLYLMAQSGSFASALPIIALYAFAGYLGPERDEKNVFSKLSP